MRVDLATLARLESLATLTGRSVADIVRTASYAGFEEVLALHAKRASAEARALEVRANEAAGSEPARQ